MAKHSIRRHAPTLIAAALAAAATGLVADPASAASALFRVKRTWLLGQTTLTNGHVTPPAGTRMNPNSPPAVGSVGDTLPVRGFTAPRSFIKNTTYHIGCDVTPCYVGYPFRSVQSSYWNAKGSFRAENPNAPTATTTIRFATTMLDPKAPPTAMGEPVTPTTTWGGRYDFSRGGSIMIWPGPNRFGGTLRFLVGPNSFFYQFAINSSEPFKEAITARPRPLSQQLGTGAEFEIGEVTESSVVLRYPLTWYDEGKIQIGTTPSGGPEYSVNAIHYLNTRAPYTTGRVRIWEPLGNTNTLRTVTGYDNRTPAGLLGTISLVHPRLVHAYSVYPSSTGHPIELRWSSAQLRRIDFRFLPEPCDGALLLALGCALLLGIDRLRGRGPDRAAG